MPLRGPDSTGSTPRSRRAYSGVSRGPAWSVRAFVAIILAILAVARRKEISVASGLRH
jgi:hypothetical protein